MTNEQLTKELIEQGKAISALQEDVKTIFKNQEEIREIAKSTQDIALSVKELTAKVCDVDERVGNIEGSQRSKNAAIWQIVMSVLISSIGTYVISNILR